jgi:tRNA(Ile)-lysidine synthase
MSNAELLARCHFPGRGRSVNLAVSGGADSTGMLLLALEAGLVPTVHHVNHHVRPSADAEADHVARLAATLGANFVVHDVHVDDGGNIENRLRHARRSVLPPDAMTAHTMDDLAETMVLNLLRGAGPAGLSPMLDAATKPVIALRRAELVAVVAAAGLTPIHDESNDSLRFRRNDVRHRVMPLLDDVAQRDVVPVLARQARVLRDEQDWIDELTASDATLALWEADCRELREWPLARLRRWLRRSLREASAGPDQHPPSLDELDRVIAVVRGEATACELSGGRRLSRTGQRLNLS